MATRPMHRDDTLDDGLRTTRRGVIATGAAAIGTAAFSGTGAAAGGSATDAGTVDGADDTPFATSDPEVRGVYAHPLWYWDGHAVATSRARMREWLDRVEETGLNVVYAWIESDGLASLLGEPEYAESPDYDFWNPERGWDPLGELVAGARDRGIEVHLWYSFTRYKRSSLRNPEYNPDLQVLPPGDPSWASLRQSEYDDGYTHSAHPEVGGRSLCVNANGAHDWTLEALARAFDRYPGLRGLHIEEPGYLAADRCVCQRCRELFADRYDTDPETLLAHTYDDVRAYLDDGLAIPIRTRGTDAFVGRLDDWWTARDGDDVLSFNGSWRADLDRVRGRNWAHWSEQGWVPYYSPQTYAASPSRFEALLAETMEALADTVVVPIVALRTGSAANSGVTAAEQVRRARSMDGYADTPVGGAGFFSGESLTPDVVVALRAGPYRHSAPPHWHPDNDASLQQRGEMTAEQLRDQDTMAFTPHWREDELPGDDPVPPFPGER